MRREHRSHNAAASGFPASPHPPLEHTDSPLPCLPTGSLHLLVFVIHAAPVCTQPARHSVYCSLVKGKGPLLRPFWPHFHPDNWSLTLCVPGQNVGSAFHFEFCNGFSRGGMPQTREKNAACRSPILEADMLQSDTGRRAQGQPLLQAPAVLQSDRGWHGGLRSAGLGDSVFGRARWALLF